MAVTILLVEDEPGLRRLAERSLARLGYAVVAADTAETAVSLCRDSPDSFRLLITDVNMPDVAGPELAERLLALRPDMTVLFVSGSAEAMHDERVLSAGGHFLQKPYTIEQLKTKLEELLA
jgi:two-component system cell cycle sensor histidine kinase/response regulator CckA